RFDVYAVALPAWVDEVAVTVCVPAADGAVYSPPPVIVPTVELPPLTPSTDQVTVGVPPPGSVTVYCWVSPGVSATFRGDTNRPVNAVATFEYGLSFPAASTPRTR